MEITGTDLGNDKKFLLNNFYEILAKKYKLLFKVIKSDSDTSTGSYPKLLDQDKDINKFFIFDETKYYWLNFEKPIAKRNIVIMVAIIFTIVSLVLFPLWPLNLKFAVWWILMAILIVLVSFLFIF